MGDLKIVGSLLILSATILYIGDKLEFAILCNALNQVVRWSDTPPSVTFVMAIILAIAGILFLTIGIVNDIRKH